ncbi:MAG: hypothetical protein CMI65_05905 [Pedosphaera sp.]|nr:hypothetical protein [Pedosphaera sp.]
MELGTHPTSLGWWVFFYHRDKHSFFRAGERRPVFKLSVMDSWLEGYGFASTLLGLFFGDYREFSCFLHGEME